MLWGLACPCFHLLAQICSVQVIGPMPGMQGVAACPLMPSLPVHGSGMACR